MSNKSLLEARGRGEYWHGSKEQHALGACFAGCYAAVAQRLCTKKYIFNIN